MFDVHIVESTYYDYKRSHLHHSSKTNGGKLDDDNMLLIRHNDNNIIMRSNYDANLIT